MMPKIRCSHCSTELQRTDRFCPNCGERVDWGTEGSASAPAVGDAAQIQRRCGLCGQINPADAAYCESCGAALAGGTSKTPHQEKSRDKAKQRSSITKSPALQLLQSWKVTVGLAVVLIVVIVLVGTSRDDERHVHSGMPADLSAQAQQMLQEIEQLQKRVDANPDDMDATLMLANRLHDVRFFPRAVTMYRKYLGVNPSTTDARVDLGICYFEMALADTTKRSEYLKEAKDEMRKALTYDPKHQLAHFNLGIVHLQTGDVKQANDWFKRCIDINPESETGKRAQELYNQHQFTNAP